MRHKVGVDRQQSSLLPESIDDYIQADNIVRVIDAFVDRFDLVGLGFAKAQPLSRGCKPYAPADLLKLYLYGYLNQVRSTRRLERECQRNLEVLWLMKRLAPDFKTIANFRKDNREPLRAVSREFVLFCRHARLITYRLVAIDGSKFKAAASKDKSFNAATIAKQQAHLDRQIEHYLNKLDRADQAPSDIEVDVEKVNTALEQLATRQQALNDIKAKLESSTRSNYCLTEPDAYLLPSGRDGMVLGYNIQSAVDVDSGLIVHHDVTNETNDTRQLQPMAESVKDQANVDRLSVVADAGYSNGEQLAACDEQGIEAAVPSNRAINNQGDFYQPSDFKYDQQRDCFICPAGELLHKSTLDRGKKRWRYARTGCNQCKLQSRCTKADKRWVSRHFYEDAFKASEARLKASAELMQIRMATVERPFAFIKHHLGVRRFQCRGMEGVKAEMALSVISYNLKQLISKLGISQTLHLLTE